MDVDVLIQRVADLSAKSKAVAADLASAKAELEGAFLAGGLIDWLDGNDRIPCEGFSLSRQVRRAFSYSPAVKAAEADLKGLKKAEEEQGLATASETISWVVRVDKEEG
jgi:hypothetical protein